MEYSQKAQLELASALDLSLNKSNVPMAMLKTLAATLFTSAMAWR